MKSYTKNLFSPWGEIVKGYDVPVLNEREVRAAAGILFLFAVTAFFNALFLANFIVLKTFIVVFFVDFCIRVLLHPRYSPTLLLGRIIVSNQTVEYAGAPQKRFAWTLGLLLSGFMLVRVVIQGQMGTINLIICLTCLTLLFLETSFGICVGCLFYNKLTGNKAKLCPGGVCEIKKKEPIQQCTILQYGIIILFLALTAGIFFGFNSGKLPNASIQCGNTTEKR
ncbi:MAG: DUF4395 domain-containing protein [Patescibacteria group bacterium]|nr:DUF4395 domain-containing protein [Patescibacteria group bacterium]